MTVSFFTGTPRVSDHLRGAQTDLNQLKSLK